MWYNEIEKVADELRTFLPELNRRIDRGSLGLDSFLRAVVVFSEEIETCVPVAKSSLARLEARALLQVYGFLLSSAERHSQGRGLPPGAASRRLDVLSRSCVELAAPAGHPPRDSIYTYCVWNDAPEPLTFTGDLQEVAFIRATNRVNSISEAVCDQLREICAGRADLESAEASARLAEATAMIRDARAELVHLQEFRDGTRTSRVIDPEFFLATLRTYWPSYKIFGNHWPGTSAATLASQSQLDFLVGTTSKDYRDHVTSRLHLLPAELRNRVRRDMNFPSIRDLFLQRLSFAGSTFVECKSTEVEAAFAKQSTSFKSALCGYEKLVKAASRLTASHWGLVQNYIVKPAESLSPEVRNRLAVRPETGSSGLVLDEVRGLREMRRRHPIVTKLIDASRSWKTHGGSSSCSMSS